MNNDRCYVLRNPQNINQRQSAMIAYVLTMPEGRLKSAFNLSRWNLCSDYMHLKNLREGNRKRAQSSFLLPANLLPWNVSPKKKAQVTLSVKRKT